jgi:hypothetical protein
LAPGPTLAQLDRNPDAAPAYTGIIADLDDHCVSGGPVDLANLAVVTRNVLEDEGVSATHLEVLRGIRDSVPPDAPRLDCDEVATAWATLMIRGQ